MLSPQHQAIQREAQLAAEQVAHGVTVLGKANFAEQGLYSQAFFSLSIGFERIGKLVYIANHALNNEGRFPTDADLKREFGHDISKLFCECKKINVNLKSQFEMSNDELNEIHIIIVRFLSDFAKSLRYYNLNFLSDTSSSQLDPIGRWRNEIVSRIFRKHYTNKMVTEDERKARRTGSVIGENSFILHSDEHGSNINTSYDLALASIRAERAQKFSRFYVLQLARWFSRILNKLAHICAYERRFGCFLGLEEPFAIFLNDDASFKSRKTWAIRR